MKLTFETLLDAFVEAEMPEGAIQYTIEPGKPITLSSWTSDGLSIEHIQDIVDYVLQMYDLDQEDVPYHRVNRGTSVEPGSFYRLEGPDFTVWGEMDMGDPFDFHFAWESPANTDEKPKKAIDLRTILDSPGKYKLYCAKPERDPRPDPSEHPVISVQKYITAADIPVTLESGHREIAVYNTFRKSYVGIGFAVLPSDILKWKPVTWTVGDNA